jgi:protein-S-isoprenylcysteine O-methyltransferase Ste14
MNEARDNVELADRLTRRRARVIAVSVVLFLSWQVNYFLTPNSLGRNVDHFKIAAWLAWALVLLLLLATGGGLFRRREVRALMEDDTTRDHRRTAFSTGFWAALGAAILIYILSMIEPVSGREASHVIISAAIGAALIAFAWLERRAMRAR